MSNNKEFDTRHNRQVEAIFRWTKVVGFGIFMINLSIGGAIVYVLIASAQWLMANAN